MLRRSPYLKRELKWHMFLGKLSGEKVIAMPKNSQDGLYYPGIVVRIINIRHSLVHFKFHHEGKAELVPSRYIIPISGAVAVPRLKVEDPVLVRMMHGISCKECFVPGIVMVLPQPLIDKPDKAFFTVMLHNKQKVTSLRKDMIRVRYHDYIVHIVSDLPTYIPFTRKGEIPQSGSYLRMNESKSSDLGVDSEGEVPREDKKKKKRTQTSPEKEQKAVQTLPEKEDKATGTSSGKERRSLPTPPLPPEERTQTSPGKEQKAVQTLPEKEDKATGTSSGKIFPNPYNPKPDIYYQLLQLRQNGRSLIEHEQVLARWPDDGWYYEGKISKDCKDYSYDVCDNNNYLERIWREDIIPWSDKGGTIKVTDHVVALHPGFKFSYAPGKVMAETSTHFTVEFYDGEGTHVNKQKVFKLLKLKYHHDVWEIHRIENRWVGKQVVTLDEINGCYNVGTVVQKPEVCNKHCYTIEFRDRRRTVKSVTHMFGALTCHSPVKTGTKILAFCDSMSGPNTTPFLPGLVKEKDGAKLQVDFFDGKKTNNLDENLCYFLSDAYYKTAVHRLTYRNSEK